MTPAQRAFDGTWTKSGVKVTDLEMNHSTANHPIAAFRATSDSLADAWFHARGNWKEDKGEQVALWLPRHSRLQSRLHELRLVYRVLRQALNTTTLESTSAKKPLDQIMARFKTTEGLDNLAKPYIPLAVLRT